MLSWCDGFESFSWINGEIAKRTSVQKVPLMSDSVGSISTAKQPIDTPPGHHSHATSRKDRWSVSKKILSQYGAGAFLSYATVSNVSTVTCLIIAWVIHGRMTGLSPLTTGQWRKYLILYAGLYGANNVLRPLRISLALCLAPTFATLLSNTERRLKISKQKAMAVVLLTVNIIGTFSYLGLGLLAATRLTGVPLLPKVKLIAK